MKFLTNTLHSCYKKVRAPPYCCAVFLDPIALKLSFTLFLGSYIS